MRSLKIVFVLAGLASLLASPAFGQQTLDFPLGAPQPFHLDSGTLQNTSASPSTLFAERVEMPGAAWMRLYFGDVVLGPGSFIRVTSELDGDVQELDADALEMWSGTTAYFNGDALTVELVAGPGARRNRLVIDQLAFEAGAAIPAGSCGICGADDRVASEEEWSGRILPAGCSASIWNADSCVVSAGHCISGGMVMQFNVPNSNGNCSLNHPPSSEQFPITSFLFNNGGVGNDWAVMTAGTNSLGETPVERYQVFRPLATSGPANGNPLQIWGFGIDNECTKSQTQQTSTGSVTSVSGLFFNHNTDATFGNSGSGILRNGEILGIVTHCPCPNWATRIDHPSFVAARENLCPVSAEPLDVLLDSVSVVIGDNEAGDIDDIASVDGSFFSADALVQGNRHTALIEVTATSPQSTASNLELIVTVDQADDNPIFLSTALFN